MYVFSLLSSAVIGAFLILFGWKASSIIGVAGTYPIALIVLSAVLLLLIFVQDSRQTRPEVPKQIEGLIATRGTLRMRHLGFVLLWAIYPFVLQGLGFLVSTSIAVTLSLWLVSRPLKVGFVIGSVATAIILTLALALLMSTVLYIPTPAGPLDDALANLLFSFSS